MRLILPSEFRTQAWKNGGGVTHEIAREDGPDGILWRLSVAEVAADGPFSAFPGLSRILTVIQGAGLWLDTPEGRIEALPFQPVAFSGGLPVVSELIGGPVRDFNLIYDGTRLAASVEPVAGSANRALTAAPGRRYAIFAVAEGAEADGSAIPEGAVALAPDLALSAGPGFRGLLVTLDHLA